VGQGAIKQLHSLARLPELRTCSIFVHAPPSRRRPANRSSMSRTEAFRSPESQGLMAKRSRPEMAPQRLEKIESAPGNGRASEASDPQDLVPVHAADRARPQLGAARMGKVAENARRSEIARCRSEIASRSLIRTPRRIYPARRTAGCHGRHEQEPSSDCSRFARLLADPAPKNGAESNSRAAPFYGSGGR
jgi:hypothetical protein